MFVAGLRVGPSTTPQGVKKKIADGQLEKDVWHRQTNPDLRIEWNLPSEWPASYQYCLSACLFRGHASTAQSVETIHPLVSLNSINLEYAANREGAAASALSAGAEYTVLLVRLGTDYPWDPNGKKATASAA